MPSIIAPAKLITGMKLLIPIKNNPSGTKQVIAQAITFLIFKSYQKIFSKVNPTVTKEVNVVRIPKASMKLTILPPNIFFNPPNPDSVV